MAKTEPLSHRIDPDLKADLKRFADEDSRSLTNYIDVVLKEHVKARKAAEAEKQPARPDNVVKLSK